MAEQRKRFLEIETSGGEDAVKIEDMTTKDLGHSRRWVDNERSGRVSEGRL